MLHEIQAIGQAFGHSLLQDNLVVSQDDQTTILLIKVSGISIQMIKILSVHFTEQDKEIRPHTPKIEADTITTVLGLQW